MMIERLNTTGSFTRIDGDYFSYSTRLSFNYKGEYFVNRTRYSATTSKHQHYLTHEDFNHTLYYQRYGEYPEKDCLNFEIKGLKHELQYRQQKRKTKQNLYEIDRINKKIDFLSTLINEEIANEL